MTVKRVKNTGGGNKIPDYYNKMKTVMCQKKDQIISWVFGEWRP